MSKENYIPIPVAVARHVAEEHRKSIVVIAAWDEKHELLHTTTYGVSGQNNCWAAKAGDLVCRALGGLPALATVYADYRVTKIEQLEHEVERLKTELRHDVFERPDTPDPKGIA